MDSSSVETLFGSEHTITLGQECARAVLVFFYGLAMLRLSGRRTFASWSALDIIVSIIIGSSLSRVLTGAAPLAGTLAAVAVLVLLHLGVAYAIARSPGLSRLIEGNPVELARNGDLDEEVRLRHKISLSDLAEALRDHGLDGLADLARVRRMVLEPSGKISVIKDA
jgi:uncharacterized membrane protein YcaP (DUF421 family)